MSLFNNEINSKITSVNKFYFLEYFQILLIACLGNVSKKEIFLKFKTLKENSGLGRSKYKKNNKNLTSKETYTYTFNEVLEEALRYNLINTENRRLSIAQSKKIFLTNEGNKLIDTLFKEGEVAFRKLLFPLMEKELNGFYYLVSLMYKANPSNGGLIILPSYSPPKLGISKNSIKLNNDIIIYIDTLTNRLTTDLKKYINKDVSLLKQKSELLSKLKSNNLINDQLEEVFDHTLYHKIINFTRNFWMSIILNDIYEFKSSLSYFDIWAYRGKQFGVVNITEFFPNFSGRIIYPVSILGKKIKHKDFKKLYTYPNMEVLYKHEPSWTSIGDKFIEVLYASYFDLKTQNKNYFVNLVTVREMVCFELKISIQQFALYLNKVYELNLKGNLTKIRISLEADRQPNSVENKYIRREPITIAGKECNIISIETV